LHCLLVSLQVLPADAAADVLDLLLVAGAPNALARLTVAALLVLEPALLEACMAAEPFNAVMAQLRRIPSLLADPRPALQLAVAPDLIDDAAASALRDGNRRALQVCAFIA
jgi:hypothetical protein